MGDTSAVDLSPENLPEEEFPRAFVLSHRWAFDTASELTLRCLQRQGPDTIVACRVATPAALVAMKLQSAPRRPPAKVQKAANVYLDLALLLSNLVLLPEIIAGLAESPHGLGVIHHLRWDIVAQVRGSITLPNGPSRSQSATFAPFV